MSLEWFDRVCSEMQDYMESICEKYDETGQMTIDRAAKHPKIEFYVELDDEGERDFFCTLFFDPHNEEFYIEEFDMNLDQTSRTILPDIEDIVDAVHESFHDYMELEAVEDDEGEYVVIHDDEGYSVVHEDDYAVGEDEYYDEQEYADEEVVEVEWTSPEVLAYAYVDEVEVAYQFGVVEDTGDGVLRRVNRIKTDDDDLIEDETNFIFSKEEAATIIELIENNMENMEGFELP
ncbi:hypothetical protein [Desertibacillus haloalkaliphilus]|uniref:hypothetical protein n=1 Tax=Desertibacillus haloalkaliphilus TaxID=1328930 RepID=UPI001C27C011|nr:hypothetical protein [Desertibacillus haloalkaliphilus]MBU8907957.1 hypothetical protein [Desertibacillus haloalkaliphilus]